MAGIFYALDRADLTNGNKPATGTSTQSKEVEIQVTTAVGVTRKDAKLVIERLIRYIESEDAASALDG